MPRPGAALPMVLLAMAMVSALAVGGIVVSRNAAASAVLSREGFELETPVEAALVEAVATWDSTARSSQPVGSEARLPDGTSGAAPVQVWITRLGEASYLLVGEGSLPGRVGLRRRLGLFVRLSAGRPMPVPGWRWLRLP